MSRCRHAVAMMATGLVLLLSCDLAIAQEQPQVMLERVADADGQAAGSLHIGEPVLLRATVTVPPDYRLEELRPSEEQQELALRPAGPASGQAMPGGGMKKEIPLLLVPLQLGDLTFAGVTIPWVSATGEAGETRSEELLLSVAGAIEDPMTAAPADIRGPAELVEPSRLGLWLAALLGAALAAAAFWWWWRRRQRPGEPLPASPPVDPFEGRSPAEWALQALERLSQDDVFGRRGAAVYHVRLSEILRRYLFGEFGIPTLERTTREVLLDADRRLRPQPATMKHMRTVLHECDMVKFARLQPSAHEAAELAQTAARVVSDTRPRPQQDVQAETPPPAGQT